MQEYKVSMDQIYIQSLHFDADTYLRAVHANTSMSQMEGHLNALEKELKNRGEDQTRV